MLKFFFGFRSAACIWAGLAILVCTSPEPPFEIGVWYLKLNETIIGNEAGFFIVQFFYYLNIYFLMLSSTNKNFEDSPELYKIRVFYIGATQH